MQITILGSGTSVPHPLRRPPAYLVTAAGYSLLVDAGAGCSTSLAGAGVPLDALSGIALTHLHPDHTGELVPLLFALHNPLGPRRMDELPIWGPPGTEQHFVGLRSVYGGWLEPVAAAVSVVEIAAGQGFCLGPLSVTAHRAQHHGSCFAYRIEAEGSVICLSGDSGPCEGLVEAARGADLLICECAALEAEGAAGHMSATDVGRLAATTCSRQLVLTHLYAHIEQSDPISRVREHYDGPVQLAEDGLALRV